MSFSKAKRFTYSAKPEVSNPSSSILNNDTTKKSPVYSLPICSTPKKITNTSTLTNWEDIEEYDTEGLLNLDQNESFYSVNEDSCNIKQRCQKLEAFPQISNLGISEETLKFSLRNQLQEAKTNVNNLIDQFTKKKFLKQLVADETGNSSREIKIKCERIFEALNESILGMINFDKNTESEKYQELVKHLTVYLQEQIETDEVIQKNNKILIAEAHKKIKYQDSLITILKDEIDAMNLKDRFQKLFLSTSSQV